MASFREEAAGGGGALGAEAQTLVAEASREALRRRGGVWRAVDLSRLSDHVAGFGLPSDRGMLLSVHGKRGRHEVLVAHMWHVPRATTIRLARLSHRATGSFRHVAGSS